MRSRSVLIIGLGRFGIHLARRFNQLGNDVMVVDRDKDKINEYKDEFQHAAEADCTRPLTIKSLVSDYNFDLYFVCMGSDFKSSLIITSLLKEMGAQKVISKASSDIHSELLRRIGADKVVYPEADHAETLAEMYSKSDHVYDVTKFADDTGIYETDILPQWAGKSIIALDIRKKYRLNILAVKKLRDDGGDGDLIPLPSADYCFSADDRIIVFGRAEDVNKLLKRMV